MAPVEQNVFVGVKFESVLLQKFIHAVSVLLDAFKVTTVNFIRGSEVGGAVGADGEDVKVRPVVCKFGNVGLQKIFTPRIKGFQIAIEKLLGNSPVKQLLRVVKFLQQPRRDVGDARVVWPRRQGKFVCVISAGKSLVWVAGGGAVGTVLTMAQPMMTDPASAAAAMGARIFIFK